MLTGVGGTASVTVSLISIAVVWLIPQEGQ